MVGIKVEVDTSEVVAAFERLLSVSDRIQPAFYRIGAYQERQFQKAFSENRSPDGAPWPPLSPRTLAQKKNSKMLVERIGRIPSSLYFEATNNKVFVGYGDPLAEIHHFGANIPARQIVPKNKKALFWAGAKHPVKRVNVPASKIPARPLIGYTQADVDEWVAIVGEEAVKAVSG